MEDTLDFLNNLGNYINEGIEEYNTLSDESEDFFHSTDPSSRRMQLLEEILMSERAYKEGIRIITDTQLIKSIDKYGQELPRYKPDTIRKKAKLGFPPDLLVNYTELWTGEFYNSGINIQVDLASDFYDFFVVGRWARFIPDEYAQMTEENEEIFKDKIAKWLHEALLREWENQYL